ncbi:unnamed protein product [Caenorhabditis angaria]|uniref:Major facilitator superfamily (MFS) profile domain-containing protein n=1 Tax=Caenorhabditis angaria TaxID=860376 RepID=A0A9P1IIF1_9PELO|nr:unnamed protein product [Caenorhabditis angaria]
MNMKIQKLEEDLDEDDYDDNIGATNLIQLLDITKAFRPYPLFITCSMAFLWSLCALSAISPAFTAQVTENSDFLTIQQDFNLTSSYIIDPAEFTTSVYFAGNLLIGQFFATLADRYGRRPVIIAALFISGIAGSLGSLASSFPLLLLARFLQGSCYTPLTTVNYVLSNESIPSRSQSVSSIFFGVSWVLGYCFLAPLSIWFPTWRLLQFATSIPCVVIGLFFVITLPESIAYSVERNQRKSVESWIKKNETFSCHKIPADIDQILEKEKKTGASENLKILQIFRMIHNDTVIIRRVIFETILWIITFMTYCALSLTSTTVGESKPIVSFLFSGIVELPAYLVIPITLKWCRRRPVRFLCHSIAAISLAILFFIVRGSTWHLPVWLLAKFCAACCYIFCFIYANELFPTYCRSCLIGVCSTFCNFGAILAPHVSSMDQFLPNLSFLLLSVTGIISALLSLAQPETKA